MWPSSSLGVAALLGLQRGRGESWDRGTALNAAALLDAHLTVELGGAPASTARAPAGDVGEVGMGHRLAGAALGTERKVEGGNGVGTWKSRIFLRPRLYAILFAINIATLAGWYAACIVTA